MSQDIGVGISFIMKNYEAVKGKVLALKNALDEVGETNLGNKMKGLEKPTANFGQQLKGALTSAKKLAFALLTVRGVWFAIRKAMTSYLSQNEELQEKLNATFYALGSLFAPLLEIMVDGLIQILGFVNAVVQALGFAGINMKNYGKETSSAAKETEKLLKIDEINNLKDSSSSSTSVADAIAAIESVQLSDKLLNFATNLGITIKDVFFEWGDLTSEQVYEKLNVAIFGLFGFAIGGLPGALVGIGIGLILDTLIFDHDGITSKTERLKETLVLALAGAIGGFMIGGGVGAMLGLTIGTVVGLTISAGDVVEANVNDGDIEQALKTAVTHEDTTIDLDRMDFIVENPQLADTSEIMEMFTILGGDCSEAQAKGYQEALASGELSKADFFSTIQENVLSSSKEMGTSAGQSFVEGEAEAIASDTETIPTAIQTATENLQGTYEQLQEDASLSGTAMITAMTSGVVDNKGQILTAWSEIKTSILGYWQELETGIKGSCNNIVSSIEGMLNGIIGGFNDLANQLNSLSDEQKSIMGVGFSLSTLNSVSLPRLATGTNYVPNDMVAMIHQGEAVVPKEFNPSAFYGTNTAEELNLLASINEQLVELNRKDYEINLDGDSVVKKIDSKINELNFRNGTKVFAIQR